ncbi:PREDICTED: RNA-binding protein 47-like [Cyphomyrmex costatus]|uniref:RNA-binding protein 47 n=1 Tax=Cyphomyrmex costatus TaxID=456900 RepID=A0A151IAN8_9HYME|nr:PREDICTED: RNA-binding protein 47-like [Cyphomyrmex costatus]KYM96563.1 RNA-binding protein 47 [Cyphomyrmex costatus]
MENKSRENRKGNRRRGSRKEDKREFRRMKSLKNDEIPVWQQFSVTDIENTVGIVEQEISLDSENFDNESEKSKSSLMCPSLRRQLQTHRNVLRLLNEHKLASTQINGQRILSIQPIRWNGPTPGIDCEIFVGRIPKTIYEDTLYPLFKMVGEVFQIRLMVDMTELTRGYCFIMYTNPEDAARAITQLDQYEISPGRKIRVLASVNKCKLYIGPLPWHIKSEEVIRVIYASAWDIEYVSVYRFPNHDGAYAIVSFKSHRNAALARRKLRPERLFKCNEVHVEWARVDWNPSNVVSRKLEFLCLKLK